MLLARELGVTLNLIGPHGEGKSSVVKQYAEENGLNYHEFRTGQAADAGDLTGLPEFAVDKNGNKFTDFILPAWFPRKENSVVFFDEVNRGAKDILNGVFEAILDLSMKGIKMPKGTQIVAAMNPPTADYSGTIDFDDKAFQDRFLHVKFAPTFEEFATYQKAKHPGSGFLSFLGEDNKMLRQVGESFTLDFVIPSPRSWETAFKLEKLYDDGKVEEGLFREMLMGIVGLSASQAAMTYKQTFVGSIKGKDVIENFHKGDLKAKIVQAVNKGRTDIIGNMIQEVLEELKSRKGLNKQEGQNLIDILGPGILTPEQGYTMGMMYAHNEVQTCVMNVEGMEGVEADESDKGLPNNDQLIGHLSKVAKAREKAAKAMEAAKNKKAKVAENV